MATLLVDTLYYNQQGQPQNYTVLILATSVQLPNFILATVISYSGSTPDVDQVQTAVPTQVELKRSASPTSSLPVSSLPNPIQPGGSITSTYSDGSSSPTGTDLNGSNQTNSPSGLSTGAVAGGAIGCLLGGALLGLAIAFFWYRRRLKNRYDDPATTSVAVVAESKGYGGMLPPPPAADKFQLDKFLLDSTSDSQIASDLRSVGTVIQSHVENNYHLGPVGVEGHTLSVALAQLGVQEDGSLEPSEIASLALNPATRQVALQHVISQVVFASIDVSARSQLSMLPTPMAAFLQSIPPRENGNHADVTSIALNKWRVLSAFLLHPARSQRTSLPVSEATIGPQAAGLADALNTFLYYFVADNETVRFQQRSNLEDVITEAAKLGYTVLSQPSQWRFVHRPGSQGGGRIAVLCAGLVKTTHRDGTPYSTPQQVVAPTVVRV